MAYTASGALEVNGHIGTIGAVIRLLCGYGGTCSGPGGKSTDWRLYRLIKEPRRMWRRYIIGNALFLWNITKEKFSI